MSGTRRSSGVTSTARGIVRELRPWQWYKQGVMFLGIVFSRQLLSIDAWIDLLIGVGAFTAIAGVAYIFNDINDVEADRNHPEKRHRPIASGQVPVTTAAAAGVLLALLGFSAAYHLGFAFVAVLIAYAGQNALYSVYLKQLVFVDVIVVAVGFVLRAIAGVVAIDVFLSPWLIVTTFLLALVLALGKRRHELESTANPLATRSVLAEYSKTDVDQLLVITMASLLMAYSLYTFFRADPAMMLTLPFAFYGVFRYHHLVHSSEVAGQPKYLLGDRPSMINLLLWAAITVAVLYGAHEAVIGVMP